MRAWLFQDHRQKRNLGDKCPWSVGWIDPDGKRRSKRIGSKSRAEKFARRTEGQLAAGTYELATRKSWAEFKKEYLDRGLVGNAAATREVVERCLGHFERIVKPVRMASISSRTIAVYVASRHAETVGKEGPAVSPATINKELRHIRAALRKAHKWGYLIRVPDISFLKELGKLPTFVPPGHLAKLYEHCDAARWPDSQPYSAADWWRALLVTAYMTGWRIGALLALRRQDVNLERGYAVSLAVDNKGKRDQRVPLHGLVVEHLTKIASFSPHVFAWDRSRRALFDEFAMIQDAAGVRPEGPKRRYGFHDLRRAFATMNAGRLTPDVLQSLMQHKAYQTTQRYINMAQQLNAAVPTLYVPTLPKISAS